MPNKPTYISRPWVKEYKQHIRRVDNSKFYNNRKWRKFTKGYRNRHPLCIECAKEGRSGATTVTDHKEQYKPGAAGWDLNNLKDKDFNPMCSSCHNKRSGRQAHGKD